MTSTRLGSFSDVEAGLAGGGGGGEHLVATGFGWTNDVTLKMP